MGLRRLKQGRLVGPGLALLPLLIGVLRTAPLPFQLANRVAQTDFPVI